MATTRVRMQTAVLVVLALAPFGLVCGLYADDYPCIYLNPIEDVCPNTRPAGSQNCLTVTAVETPPGSGNWNCGGAVQYKPATDLWTCPDRAQPVANATNTCHRTTVSDGTDDGEVVQHTCYFKTVCKAEGLGNTWSCKPNPNAVTPYNDAPVWFSEECGNQPADPPGGPQ